MTIDPTGAATSGLVDRVKNILLTPKAEWAKIATETPDQNKLFIGYALPLLAVAAICGFIGMTMIGLPFIGRVSMVWGVTDAILKVAIGLVSLFITAVIANALAPSFGSRQDMGRAQQLVVYGSTAGLVAGVLAIVPPLAVLSIIGSIYSIVLIYFGLPAVMNTPADKQAIYLIVLILACIVVFWVLFWVMGIIMASIGFSALGAAASMGRY
ncbi:MAG: Yip1 family protein [Hyphomonadaceae bacterium]